MTINQVGVVGSGTMGGAIAHVAAISGYEVVLCDVDQAFLERAISRMEAFMNKSIEKGKMSSDQKADILNRITCTTNLQDFHQSQVVIEAIIEDLEAKKDIFKQLDEILPSNSIIASNTSSMSITDLAAVTNRPEQVAGMHFFNPPQIMKLVEVVRGYSTSDQTVEQLKDLSQKLGKEPIEVKKDTPGFIVNRIMIPQFIEAVRLVEEGVATPEDIDKAVTLGLNYPMGPFTLQDYAGVDIGLHVMDYFYDEFKDNRFAAPLTLRNLVRAGRVGKKAGAGWFDYNK
ncbi:3-hydroxyacyl-CoA dehydrogenase family protein [Desertibacillus haloalkaliphilus]|uniref:3-hydroxyacyl-CoA dehydrogenase family protein n=1 Tax=Desertibacillus haloalkaliphilus TaxID=1328930 RepID=UPI001C2651D3|nr:3-hydroxyacyl-CoA dehydrogenase family protein [Desertibacillus haloalkaliphilus]MBU8908296.1 3-hydroxyacyl-CoA dehydrogenase family protein [Desertibacillus haloalkaliphilus]